MMRHVPRPGPGYMDGFWGPGILPGLFMILLFGLLVAVAIMLVINLRRGRIQIPGQYAPWKDPALEAVRMRYARGEIGHEEFTSISQRLRERGPAGDTS
jgi:uncharacterized membrane protein